MFRSMLKFVPLSFLMIFFFMTSVHAATFCVDDLTDGPQNAADCDSTCDSPGDCSLRDASYAANADGVPDEIIFSVTGTYTYTETDEIYFTKPVTVTGPGADQLTIDAGNQPAKLRVIEINLTGGSASISGLTITGGNPAANGGGINVATGSILNLSDCVVTGNTVDTGFNGGGIYNSLNAILNIDGCVISDNSARNGGGLANSGDLTIKNSTFSGNYTESGSSDYFGGAIVNANGSAIIENSAFVNNTADDGGGAISNDVPLTVTNCTFSGNTVGAGGVGGAINNKGAGSVDIENCTFTENMASAGGALSNLGIANVKNTILANSVSGENCNGAPASSGVNLDSGVSCGLAPGESNTDPDLDVLQYNGGETMVHPLKPGSPAIDAIVGDCTDIGAAIIGKDQRGFDRPVDGDGDGNADCDIGAYEVGTCGDGGIDDGEECDDGNNDDNDGCSSTCTDETTDEDTDGDTDEDATDDTTEETNGGCSISPKSSAKFPGVFLLILSIGLMWRWRRTLVNY
jgi:cysteine-rich repeat protein